MTAHYASLHSGLLARKGDAAPAASPPPAPVPLPMPHPVTRQETGCVHAVEPAASPRKTGEVRQCSSVRLTSAEKRRLRAAAAALGLPHQQVIADALNDYLDRLSAGPLAGCACLRPGPD